MTIILGKREGFTTSDRGGRCTIERSGRFQVEPADNTNEPQLDDEALLRLIGSHDEGALSSLYERYSRLLYAIALRITGDTGSAEEVTQDAFQAVWQRAAQWRPTAGSVQAWLSGIARNRAIDEVRSRWHRARQTECGLDGMPALHAAVERGWEHLTILRSDMQEALAKLPAKQRQAIEMAFYGGLTSHEIASRMDESVGTIRSRLRLGIEKLRDAANSWFENN